MRCLIFTLAPRASIGESQGLNWYRLGVARLPWRSIEIGGARVAGLDGCCHDVPLVDFSWETFPIDGGRGHQTFQAAFARGIDRDDLVAFVLMLDADQAMWACTDASKVDFFEARRQWAEDDDALVGRVGCDRAELVVFGAYKDFGQLDT